MTVQKEFPSLNIVASGLSFLQGLASNLAAGLISRDGASFVGFGRETLAYPDFLHDIRETGEMNKDKVCVACGQCSVLLRSGREAGCTVRDKGHYMV